MKESKENTYISAWIKQKAIEMKQNGVDVIDFSVGDPDIEPLDFVLEDLSLNIKDARNSRYPTNESEGIIDFRKSVSEFYYNQYNVNLNPNEEIISLIGSKEGAHYLCLALVKPKDVVIVCNPAYTTYKYSAELAGAEVYSIDISEENNYIPDLEHIPENILKRTKLFFINYPNNPTGAICTMDFFDNIVKLARKYKFIICNDNAYGQLYYDGEKSISLLQAEEARDVVVETNSISKTYNLCGWRVGMLVGNKDVIRKVLNIKRYTDAGIFMPIQKSASKLLRMNRDYVNSCIKEYCIRRNYFVEGLRKLGYKVRTPKAGIFLWVSSSKKLTSMEIMNEFISVGIVCNPGIAFGENGEGFIRIALVQNLNTIKEALNRLKNINV